MEQSLTGYLDQVDDVMVRPAANHHVLVSGDHPSRNGESRNNKLATCQVLTRNSTVDPSETYLKIREFEKGQEAFVGGELGDICAVFICGDENSILIRGQAGSI